MCRLRKTRSWTCEDVSQKQTQTENGSAQRKLSSERHGLRSEVNIELKFLPKLRGARSRLYRRRFLQVNTRWKALAEIYTMHSFAPFSNLIFFVKNRQNFFAIE